MTAFSISSLSFLQMIDVVRQASRSFAVHYSRRHSLHAVTRLIAYKREHFHHLYIILQQVIWKETDCKSRNLYVRLSAFRQRTDTTFWKPLTWQDDLLFAIHKALFDRC